VILGKSPELEGGCETGRGGKLANWAPSRERAYIARNKPPPRRALPLCELAVVFNSPFYASAIKIKPGCPAKLKHATSPRHASPVTSQRTASATPPFPSPLLQAPPLLVLRALFRRRRRPPARPRNPPRPSHPARPSRPALSVVTLGGARAVSPPPSPPSPLCRRFRRRFW